MPARPLRRPSAGRSAQCSTPHPTGSELATKLAAAASPCAEYYVSVPPLVADKTTFRRDQAWRIRALGPNFHAMAEIHFATWTRWVQSTGNSWHAAGVTARERMAAAGYDVALGDTWALNELTSAVRRGDGNARTNIREFLRGLYEGDGSRPTRGAALVIGFGQRTADVSAYQNTLQGWLSDTAFWTDMATYVSDWSQEVYGDLRSHAVSGSDVAVRREYLNDYLQHKLVLAGAGPAEIEPARAYLREAYSPLANGAWPRETAWGWTMVPFEQMAAYVSAQVDAMRSFSVSAGQARDHWGFAWAPRNTTGLPNADFAAQTGQILDRMAAAIRDSGVADPEEPGQRRVRRGPDVVRGGSPGGVAQRGLAIVPRLGAVDPLDRARRADQGRRRRRVGAARAVRGVRGRATRRRDAPFELPGRRVLDERRRAVDELADRARRARHRRLVLLPRHARRCRDADRRGAGYDASLTRGDGRRRRRDAHLGDACLARGAGARRVHVHR